MASFEELNTELDVLRRQGYTIDQAIEELIQKYSLLADDAKQLLLQKQTFEREKRISQENEDSINHSA